MQIIACEIFKARWETIKSVKLSILGRLQLKLLSPWLQLTGSIHLNTSASGLIMH